MVLDLKIPGLDGCWEDTQAAAVHLNPDQLLLSNAELTVIAHAFTLCADQSGLVQPSDLPRVLTALLKCPTPRPEEVQALMGAIPDDKPVSFDVFMQVGMGMWYKEVTQPCGITTACS